MQCLVGSILFRVVSILCVMLQNQGKHCHGENACSTLIMALDYSILHILELWLSKYIEK